MDDRFDADALTALTGLDMREDMLFCKCHGSTIEFISDSAMLVTLAAQLREALKLFKRKGFRRTEPLDQLQV